MKINKYSIVCLGVLVSVTILGSQSVKAEETTEPTEVSKGTSKANFELQATSKETEAVIKNFPTRV